jgi:two-component sensor histidine kinase
VTEPPRVFCADDTELLTMFATQAAIAIQNARLYEQTQQDAETKATLLREVNHRVRNNLSAIIGLLELENLRMEEDTPAAYQTAMQDLTNRVQGLATVHHLLSVTEWSPLLLSDLAEQIIESALTTLPADKHVSAEISPSPVRIAAKYANNMALIINELITNSIKHAWPTQNTGRVNVRIDLQENDMVVFEFRDNGVGYPEEMLCLSRHSVGWGLIQSFIERSLQGEVTLRNDGGSVTSIRFPMLV